MPDRMTNAVGSKTRASPLALGPCRVISIAPETHIAQSPLATTTAKMISDMLMAGIVLRQVVK